MEKEKLVAGLFDNSDIVGWVLWMVAMVDLFFEFGYELGKLGVARAGKIV
jgi:hypothetical protein